MIDKERMSAALEKGMRETIIRRLKAAADYLTDNSSGSTALVLSDGEYIPTDVGYAIDGIEALVREMCIRLEVDYDK